MSEKKEIREIKDALHRIAQDYKKELITQQEFEILWELETNKLEKAEE